ncbi:MULTISPECIES: TetR/AcrR family transcriptional regulator [unclassified Nocardia]|uniref:TetR/AcrR family transcriptional regulator n=1 Tax=unclassified Nocardia TaxID=2637762 RepID=UPI0035E3B120
MVVPNADVDERILDAALHRISQVGIRRASVDDIARGCGITRITIYRRFISKENLVDAVLTREVHRLLSELTTIAAVTDSPDVQIEESVLHVLRQTHAHPLLSRLTAVAPEEAVAFYTLRGGEIITLGIDYIVEALGQAQRGGLIDQYDPRPVAELLARLAHSLLLTPAGGLRLQNEETAREFVRGFITPLVKHGIKGHSSNLSG